MSPTASPVRLCGRNAQESVPSSPVTSSSIPPTSSSKPLLETTAASPRYQGDLHVGGGELLTSDQVSCTLALPTGTPLRVEVSSRSEVLPPGAMSTPSGASATISTVGGRASATTKSTATRPPQPYSDIPGQSASASATKLHHDGS